MRPYISKWLGGVSMPAEWVLCLERPWFLTDSVTTVKKVSETEAWEQTVFLDISMCIQTTAINFNVSKRPTRMIGSEWENSQEVSQHDKVNSVDLNMQHPKRRCSLLILWGNEIWMGPHKYLTSFSFVSPGMLGN